MTRLEQLHEGTLAAERREFVATVQVHDLAEERHFLHAARDETANFAHNFLNRSAPLRAAGPRDDAKGAMHIAALHDRDERGRLPLFQFVVANRFGGAAFLLRIAN